MTKAHPAAGTEPADGSVPGGRPPGIEVTLVCGLYGAGRSTAA